MHKPRFHGNGHTKHQSLRWSLLGGAGVRGPTSAGRQVCAWEHPGAAVRRGGQRQHCSADRWMQRPGLSQQPVPSRPSSYSAPWSTSSPTAGGEGGSRAGRKTEGESKHSQNGMSQHMYHKVKSFIWDSSPWKNNERGTKSFKSVNKWGDVGCLHVKNTRRCSSKSFPSDCGHFRILAHFTLEKRSEFIH